MASDISCISLSLGGGGFVGVRELSITPGVHHTSQTERLLEEKYKKWLNVNVKDILSIPL